MVLAKLINQKPYEKIEYLLHRHPIAYAKYLIIFLILMLVPVGVYFLINDLYPDIFLDKKYLVFGVLGASTYYLSIYLFWYASFVDFYLDIWIVTNDRIINMEQKGLLATSVTEVDLYRIQDVTVNTKGLFQTLLNYGDVVVKTASQNLHIIFRKIPNPNEVRQALIELAENDRRFHVGQT